MKSNKLLTALVLIHLARLILAAIETVAQIRKARAMEEIERQGGPNIWEST